MAGAPVSTGRLLGLVLGLALVALYAGAPAAARDGPSGPAPPDGSAARGAPPGAAGPGTAAGAATAYAWPLRPVPAVEVAFREPTHRFGPGHRGVDLAAEKGAAVLASAPGTVVFAGALAGRGVVSVQHPDGQRTTYEPVAAVVTRGTSVAATGS